MNVTPLPEVDDRPVEDAAGRLAHYVRKEDILAATVYGVPVRALCGKVWVPDRDPSRYPVCAVCTSVFHRIDRALKAGNN